MTIDSTSIRDQFPILNKMVNDKPLVYLDNAATTQKPLVVIEAITKYYQEFNANIHRGVHQLSETSTQVWEESRQQVADFFGASPEELIVTRNTTEALNILARGWEGQVRGGDAILVGLSEHHSNFVPWQEMASRRRANFVVLPLLEDGQLDLAAAEEQIVKLGERVKVIALSHISNTLGSLSPIDKINDLLVKHRLRDQVLLVVDGAQSAARLNISWSDWGVDALAFSGHKMYGPMGVGGLLLKKEKLEKLIPILFGGGMIAQVTPEKTEFSADVVDRFTAGTPDVASLFGLAAACQWLEKIGWESIVSHELDLTNYAYDQLSKLTEINLVGPKPVAGDNHKDKLNTQLISRLGSVTWLHRQVHAHDVAQILDRYGVAVRSGHHCAMPLHLANNWPATTRASFAVYNTRAEVDTLVEALSAVKKTFGQ
jgi:cysteine desulfurase/selenocysteine lyase